MSSTTPQPSPQAAGQPSEQAPKHASKKAKVKKTLLDDLLIDATKIKEQIDKILTECADIPANTQKIEDAYATFLQSVETHKASLETAKQSIQNVNAECETRHQEIDDYYSEVFGYTESGKEVTGLKYKLEQAYQEIEEKFGTTKKQFDEFQTSKAAEFAKFLTEKKQACQDLEDKVESLLPGALSAGLSSAYQAKRESIVKDQRFHSRVFYVALAAICVWCVYYLFSSEKSDSDPWHLVRCVVIVSPVLWLAIFANRKINLTWRLIEEYSHKETVSKTFEGLSKEIQKETGEESDVLRNQLLKIILEMNSQNPGKLVTGYDTSDHPLTELTKLLNIANKLPGFDLQSFLAFLAAWISGKTLTVSESDNKERDAAKNA